MKKIYAVSSITALLFALTGCGDNKPPEQARAKVSGTVTLDNKPLKTGAITFDTGTGQPSAVMDILDGKYEGNAPVGKCKVQITAFEKMTMKEKLRKQGKPVVEGPGYDELVEFNLLPDRYNTKSEIKREVEAGKINTFPFDLQSK